MGAPVQKRRDNIHKIDGPGGEAVKKHCPWGNYHQRVEKPVAGDLSPQRGYNVSNLDIGHDQQTAKL